MRPDASAKLAAHKPKGGPSKVLIGAVIAAVLIIVLVVVVIVNAERSKTDSDGNAVGPTSSLPGGGGVVLYQDKVKADAPTVDVYEDFQCPFCKHLEAASGDEFNKLAKAGDIKLIYHLKTILDQAGRDDSLRASNAAYCADEQGKFEQYHKVVFTNQPQEGVGYTDEQLKSFGPAAGIKGDAQKSFDKCLDTGKYLKYAMQAETKSQKAGVFSTPVVKINDKKVSDTTMNKFLQDPSAVAKAVKAAKK